MILLSWVHICKNECLFLSLILNNSIKSYPSGPFLKLIRSLQDGSAPALTQLPIQYWISIVSLVSPTLTQLPMQYWISITSLVITKINTLKYINNDTDLLVDKTIYNWHGKKTTKYWQAQRILDSSCYVWKWEIELSSIDK